MTATHRVRRSWHFAEDCQVERVGSGLKITRRCDAVVFRATRNARQLSKCIAVVDREQGGWVSRSFGRKTATHDGVLALAHHRRTVLRTRITYTRSRAVGL